MAIKWHYFFCFGKDSHKKEETANDGSSTTFSMVTMKHCNPFRIFSQVSSHSTADDEKSIERRSFVVLPFVANDIFEDCLIDASAAYVDSYVFVLVA